MKKYDFSNCDGPTRLFFEEMVNRLDELEKKVADIIEAHNKY